MQLRPHRKERERHNSSSGGNCSSSSTAPSENISDTQNKGHTVGHFDLKHSGSQNSLNNESAYNSASNSGQTSPTSSASGDTSLQGDGFAKPPKPSMSSSGDADGTATKVSNRQSKIFTSDPSPAVIAQTNWTFVETMLSVSYSWKYV